MVQLLNKANIAVPAILSTNGANKTFEMIAQANIGNFNFEFKSEIYGHDEVKSSLKVAQYDKCCFCEAKISHISYGDVEHFRPKGGYVQDNENINKPGYYWLAYDWDNLLLSCQICNQRNKKNYFPLEDNSKRNIEERNIGSEVPLFVNPAFENPEMSISFDKNIPIGLNEKGKITIAKLGLDRDELNNHREIKYNLIKTLYDLLISHSKIPLEIWENAKENLIKQMQPQEEYSLMIKCFIAINPLP